MGSKRGTQLRFDGFVIDHVTVGRHRRIKAENLFAYKKARDSKRSDALSGLAELDAEHL